MANGIPDTIEPINPTIRNRVFNSLFDFFAGDSQDSLTRQRAARRANMVSSALDFIPFYGESADISDAKEALDNKNYLQAGLLGAAAVAGQVPALGDAASKGIRSIARSIERPGALPNIDNRKFMQDVMDRLELDVSRASYDVPTVNLSDYEGKTALLTMADRTPSGGLLYGINDVNFESPQALGGGRDYMFNESDYPGQVWANSQGYVTAVQNAMKKGKDSEYVILPFGMGTTSVEFPTMHAGTHLRYARQSMSDADARYVDSLIRQNDPDFPGIKSDAVLENLGNMTGPQRKNISNTFDMVNNPSPAQIKNGIRKVDGALSNTQATIAITDPEQYTDPNVLGIRNIGLLSGESAPSMHETYSTGFLGQGIGRLDRPMTARDFLPELFKKPLTSSGSVNPTDAYTMRLGVRTAPITEGLLKRLGY